MDQGHSSNEGPSSSSSSGDQTGMSTYTPEDQNFAKFFIFLRNVVTKVLLFVFQMGSADRLPNESLWDFYRRKGIDVCKFRKGLNNSQFVKVDSDPSGVSFDATLLYRCLRFGCHNLSPGEDQRWSQKDGSSIESLITIVKNQKNELAHDLSTLTTHQLAVEMDRIRTKLIHILEFCRVHYGLPDATIDQEIANVRNSVKQHLMDPFSPNTFEEQKKLLYYDVFVDLLENEGRQEIEDLFEKGLEFFINPLNHILNTGPLPLKHIFVKNLMVMKNKKDNKDLPVSFENILVDEEGNANEKTTSVVIISGPAGAGKTMLTKKMTLDWRSKNSEMKFLVEHKLFIKVVCRSRNASNLKELIKILMPETCRNLNSDDMKNTMLDLNIMIIMDGVDELNERSTELFREVLELKKRCVFTLLITTRPEKLQYLKKELKSHSIESKMIHLLGVPVDKVPDLCRRYYEQIRKKVPNAPEVKLLLDHLDRTQHKLADLWRLPVNLILMTILFVFRNGDIAKSNTQTRLCREICNLYKANLKERCLANGKIDIFDEATLNRKIDHFIYILAKEALITLKENQIHLTLKSYEELKKVCHFNGLDVNEMVSAFLQMLPDKTYSFPHKILKEYLAAHYVWSELTKKIFDYKEEDFLKVVVWTGQSKGVQQGLVEELLNSAYLYKRKQSSKISIESILADVHISTSSHISEYQNMMMFLMGISFLEKDQIMDAHRVEVLKLLQKTGICDMKDWIMVLNSIECDPFVASYISKEGNFLKDNVLIQDFSLSAYIFLLKSIDAPESDPRKVNIDLDIKDKLEDFISIVKLIKHHQFKLRTIVINNKYQELLEVLKAPEFPFFHGLEVDVKVSTPIIVDDFTKLREDMMSKEMIIRTIVITDTSTESFTNALKDPRFPFLDPQEVEMAIEVTKELPNIQNLLEEIKRKQLVISKLQTSTKEILILDHNFIDEKKKLEDLPQLKTGAFGGRICITLDRRCQNYQEILTTINRKKLPLNELHLIGFLKNRRLISKEVSEEIDETIKKFSGTLEVYCGPFTEIVGAALGGLQRLDVSVVDDKSLYALTQSVFKKEHRLQSLVIRISREAAVGAASRGGIKIKALDGVHDSAVEIHFPDIAGKDISAVFQTAMHLTPKHPIAGLWELYFPRIKCRPIEVIEGLPDVGIQIRGSVVFHLRSRPNDAAQGQRMQRLVKERTGCTHGIQWSDLNDGRIPDLDSW